MLCHELLFTLHRRVHLLQSTGQELGQFRADVRNLPQLFRRGSPGCRSAAEVFQQSCGQTRPQAGNQGQGQMIP
jgi:hypothetical protein